MNTYVSVQHERDDVFSARVEGLPVTPRDALRRALAGKEDAPALQELSQRVTYITFESGSPERRVQMDEDISEYAEHPTFSAIIMQTGQVVKWIIVLEFVRGEASVVGGGAFATAPANRRIMLEYKKLLLFLVYARWAKSKQ